MATVYNEDKLSALTQPWCPRKLQNLYVTPSVWQLTPHMHEIHYTAHQASSKM